MLNDKTSNTVNVASVMSGMERLKNTADTKGGVLISEDFISGLRNLIDTKGLFNNEDLSIKRFKFVKREKPMMTTIEKELIGRNEVLKDLQRDLL